MTGRPLAPGLYLVRLDQGANVRVARPPALRPAMRLERRAKRRPWVVDESCDTSASGPYHREPWRRGMRRLGGCGL